MARAARRRLRKPLAAYRKEYCLPAEARRSLYRSIACQGRARLYTRPQARKRGDPLLSVLRAVLCCAIALLAGHASAQTSAQNWPSRPIKLIVPTGPGAATDV